MYFILMELYCSKLIRYLLLLLILRQLSFSSLSYFEISDTPESNLERVFESVGRFDGICSVIVKNIDYSSFRISQARHFEPNFIGYKKHWLSFGCRQSFTINPNSPVLLSSQPLHTDTVVLLI